MNTDKAYIFGLITGGGIFGTAEDTFRIRLPYKHWGSYKQDPSRASQISRDILNLVSPLFRTIYGLSISYTAVESGEWNILCEGDLTSLKDDLTYYGISAEGELKKHVEIDKIVADLVDVTAKRRFIAGLADTIGSIRESQRQFDEDKQIISFEIGGESFNFVCSLCKLLYSINCYPDQVLWQHPNFQCGSNPFYSTWKTKGHKVRVLLDQYAEFGSFAFTSKAHSSLQNRQLEKQTNVAKKCEDKKMQKPSFTCVHNDENSEYLPTNIRGGHYIHNKHICAVLGCEHAPYNQVSNFIKKAEEYVSPFPILIKGAVADITKIIDSNPLYSKRIYTEHNILISFLYSQYQKKANSLLFSTDNISGYPINQVMKAVTFLVAGQLNSLTKSGGSAKGKMDDLLNHLLNIDSNVTVKIEKPNLLTPIIITLNEYSALVGASNPVVYKKLIKTSLENRYKITVDPITEDDLI